MFIIVGTLLVLQEASKETADKIQAFFNPALNWIQRWLPLFYVPTLVVLPVAIQGIQGGLPFPGYCTSLLLWSTLHSDSIGKLHAAAVVSLITDAKLEGSSVRLHCLCPGPATSCQ